MDKKFLSAEEAIAHFGLDPVQFQHMVDEGELRALADRGTWKYRRDEIEGLIEEGLLKPVPAEDAASAQTLEFDSPEAGAGPDDLSFIELDEAALAEGATTIKKQTDFDFLEQDTPSEVFLVPDDQPAPRAPMADSVSDVRLAAEPADDFGTGLDNASSDSPPTIEYSQSESDIGTEDLPAAESLSEFEMKLSSNAPTADDDSVIVGNEDLAQLESDSDVKVVTGSSADSDSDVALADEMDASGITLAEGSSGIMESDSDVSIADSGITLEKVDSGITLERLDSGISLEQVDSGMTLEGSSVVSAGDSAFMDADSGISLEAADSGLTLDAVVDSGISLESGDSGISLGGVDSGIRLDEQTGRPKRPQKPAETEVEIDANQFDSQEFAETSDSSGIDQTAMIVMDDDDAASQATLPPTKGKKPAGLSDSFEMVEEVEDLEIADDLEAAELDVDAVEDEDEVIEDILDASDEVFLDGESEELSEEGISAVSAVKSAVSSGPKEPSWGIWAVLPVAACALLLAVNGLILWEGVSTMWTGAKPTVSGGLVDSLGGQ